MRVEAELRKRKERVAKESLRRKQFEPLHRILTCSRVAPGLAGGSGGD